ncbi:hypothetical protein AALO_G00262530 [Alosa alosa]|uniref:Zinc finger and BTB domain-containing protein 8B n=1 Tax=Alosa alosa TaxID=278164 RepID=A0AAV6FQS6_9TELE|nr:zinc finger and BTB domain-containing protein 8B [Alosa alosa]KAG5265204.1 hypothetical protein AALO_G00262530 [Alosa alosa]
MEIPSYMSKLLCELNEQRKRDFFCDCSIIVEGQVFKAHRNILFAGSGYFRALLVHYLQDSGQRHSTASLDIVTATAFSLILDFLYSGRLDLCSDNVIEVMSAASYLQMTDVVNFCKSYIHDSLEICSRGKEQETQTRGEREKEAQGPADSRTPAEGPSITVSPTSQDGRTGTQPITQCSHNTPPNTTISAALSSRHSEESESSRGQASTAISVDPPVKRDPENPAGCSSGNLLFGFVHPKIEFDPDEENEESPQSKEAGHFSRSTHFDSRTLAASLSASAEATAQEYDSYQAKMMQYYSPGIGGGAVAGRGDEGMGLGSSASMEIHSDWFGEDAGDGLVVSVKLHKCPYCPYTSKQRGILKRHIRCHTGERPYPCHTCGKRFTRQEHLRSHALSVHRTNWPVVCKGCRRVFTDGVSHSLKRSGLCEGCTCVTTTQQDPGSTNPSSQSEGSDRSNTEPDWPVFMDDGNEAEGGN